MDPIELTPDDVKQCVEFGSKALFLNSQSREQLGGGSFRDAERFVRDQTRGKLAEIAFQRVLQRYDLEVDLDFEHYASALQGDRGDVSAVRLGDAACPLSFPCDVKSTTDQEGWLLVGADRLEAGLYALVSIPEFPAEGSPYDLVGRSFTAHPIGWVDQSDFWDANGAYWFDAGREGGLPDPSTIQAQRPANGQRVEEVLGSDSAVPVPSGLVALPASWLRTEWDELAGRLAAAVRVPVDWIPHELNTDLAKALAGADPRYSLIVRTADPVLEPVDVLLLLRLLQRGVQLYYAGPRTPERRWFQRFIKAGLLQAFTPDDLGEAGVQLVVDGLWDPGREDLLREDLLREDLLNELDFRCRPAWPEVPPFNRSQFLVEHAPPDANMCIRAGAGTGKTTVMVGRVLFLLHIVDGLQPKDIAMITFTRESAHTMRVRLRDRILARYRATGERKYVHLLEQIGAMSIRTIHSFAKEMLDTLGSVVGYGRGVSISEFSLERRQILERLVDDRLGGRTNLRSYLQVELWRFVKAAESFWAELGKKGLTREEIANVHWGQAAEGSEPIHRVLQDLIPQAEEALAGVKTRSNAVSMSDMIRTLDEIRTADVNLRDYLPAPPRYLFVDEFQDTDDVQIRLVVWIHRAFGTCLFTVGDVKQSIYRFRGATHEAFAVLDELLAETGTNTETYRLTRNYRTSRKLLEDLHPYFSAWGSEGLLEYDPAQDRLAPAIPGDDELIIDLVDRRRLDEWIRQTARLAHRTTPQHEQTAFLVRTNAQALEVKERCREAGVPCQVVSGGTFYRSAPVVDFLHLVRGLLFPEDPASRLDLQNSPYSGVAVHWSAVAGLQGRPEPLLSHLQSHPPQPGWEEHHHELRFSPVLSVLRKIVQQAAPTEHVYSWEFRRAVADGQDFAAAEDLALQSAREYSANLAKLGQILRTQFASQATSLDALRQFLETKRATDRDEDEAVQSPEEEARVICRTVHKAKGQEYDTVILPLTSLPFSFDRDELLLNSREGRWEAGWRLQDRNNRVYENDLYSQIRPEEDTEVRAEETRLLYVALTRAKKRLWVASTGNRPDTWAGIVAAAGLPLQR